MKSCEPIERGLTLGSYHVSLPDDQPFLDRMIKLSHRERQTLLLFATGKSGKEIMQKMNIKRSTLETYKSRILIKTGCRTILEASVLMTASILGASIHDKS